MKKKTETSREKQRLPELQTAKTTLLNKIRAGGGGRKNFQHQKHHNLR